NEAKCKEHWHLQIELTKGDRRQPVEDFHGGRDSDQGCAGGEERLRNRRQTDGEHVVRPHGEAQEANRHARPGNEGVTKDWLAREHRQDFGDNAEDRQDQDIHLWVTKRPEQVLPEQRITTERVLVEIRSQVAVQQQQDSSSGQAGQSKQQQEGRYQLHPGKQGHTVDAHPRSTQFQDSDHEVKGTSNRRDTEHQNAQNPEVIIHARCTQGSMDATGRLVQGSVVEPTTVRGLTEQEAGLHENATKDQNPVAKGIHAREGHIARTDHQRHDIVTKARERRHHEQKDHGHAVHGEDLVILFRAQHLAIRLRQLCANKESLHTAHQKEKEASDYIHNADQLMIGGRQPLTNIRFTERLSTNRNGCAFADSVGCHKQFLQNLAQLRSIFRVDRSPGLLFQALQICHQLTDLLIRQLPNRHIVARFYSLWI